MKRIDLYLGRALASGAALALLALVAIDGVIELVDEVADVDDDYTLGDALHHTGLMLIASIYELLPVAVLIGGVVSLGNLAAQSELVAFRTLRYSRARITASVLMTGSVLMAVTFALGETAVPAAVAKAHAVKEGRGSGPGEAAPGSAGRWLRDGAYFLYMEEALGDDSFGGVTMYQLNDEYHLARVIEARRADARGREWRLADATVSELRDGRIEIERHERLVLARAMPEIPGGVGAAGARRSDLSRMNILQLMDYIEFLRASDLPSAPQELALWTRFSAALATLVMLLLAVPWLFFSTRGVAAGKRLFFAIVVGLSYMIGSRIIGDAAIVYRVPPVLGAFLPIIVFAAAGTWWIRRRRLV